MKVLIIGGSIAGLSAANSLRNRNIDFVIFERGRKRAPKNGGGIAVHNDTIDYLKTFPVDLERLNEILYPMPVQLDNNKNGGIIRMGDIPFHSAHWAEVYNLLADSIPLEKFCFGKELVNVTQTGDGVEAEFKDGTKIKGSVLIGADGILSTVRKLVFSDDIVRYAGYFAWRGILPKEELSEELPKDTFILEMSGSCHAVIYHLGNRINWLVYENVDNGKEVYTTQEQVLGKISRDATEQELLDFKQMVSKEFRPLLAELFTKTPLPFINHIYDRDPANHYRKERVLLIGDAAHPVTPHFIRGSNMAIQDGYFVGKLFDSDHKKWFSDFEKQRVQECNDNVRIAKQLGRLKQGLILSGKDWTLQTNAKEFAEIAGDGIVPKFIEE
ncbi:hypothetical protein HK103_005596 [Boothiomyces macroporosus]|uniref:FAD-binding domain-containing protein n=1 Tax=Boothiomyces macroporosus TaxID=261099 RepID=A0AAD5UFE4_9FUNG|nr:hypothetical protein HK103_005596 [Boothiomyces macroporosus]